MALTLKKNEGETWLDAALREAKKYGLQGEVQEWYDKLRAAGVDEAQAAWEALYEWDCVPFVP